MLQSVIGVRYMHRNIKVSKLGEVLQNFLSSPKKTTSLEHWVEVRPLKAKKLFLSSSRTT